MTATVAGACTLIATAAAGPVPDGCQAAASRGARLAALGNGRGAVSCASCHGFDGAADPSGGFPRLAGQSPLYLRRALDSFASGSRRNALMTPISKAMTDAERDDAAAYYAAQRTPVPPSAPVDGKLVEAGRVIATVGVNDQQIPACTACHGPYGQSVTPTTPSLAGQYGSYIGFQLRMFRDGERKAGAASMATLAHALTDEQVLAVGAYFQRVAGPPAGPDGPVP